MRPGGLGVRTYCLRWQSTSRCLIHTNKESDIDLFSIDGKKIEHNMILKTASLIGRNINIKSTTESKFSSSLKNNDPLINEVVSNHIVLKGVDKFCDIMWRYYETK